MGRPALPLRASQNLDANPVAAPIILLMPALYLPVGLGMPLPNLTCAKTLTKADPVLALHALTNTGVTSPDAQQPTLWKTTQQRGISQIHDHWKEESGFKKPEVASSKYSDNNNFLPLVAISFVNYCSNLGFFRAKWPLTWYHYTQPTLPSSWTTDGTNYIRHFWWCSDSRAVSAFHALGNLAWVWVPLRQKNPR